MALPREVGALAETYYGLTASHAANSANAVQQLWDAVPPDMSIIEGWNRIAPSITDIVAQEQVASGVLANAYLQAQSDVQGFDLLDIINPAQFVTPTDNAQDWLSYAVTASMDAANRRGLPEVQARAVGRDVIVRTSGTMVNDAGREATQAILCASSAEGYYRKLRTPSCSRCAILAGAFYGWSRGFRRHPRCDCQHVPAAEVDDSLEFDPVSAVEAGQVTGLSEAELEAIRDGADPSQIVNAHRGKLRTVDIYGKRVRTTLSGTTRRGAFYVPGQARLTPTEIFKQANGDRDAARLMLARYGYLSDAPRLSAARRTIPSQQVPSLFTAEALSVLDPASKRTAKAIEKALNGDPAGKNLLANIKAFTQTRGGVANLRKNIAATLDGTASEAVAAKTRAFLDAMNVFPSAQVPTLHRGFAVKVENNTADWWNAFEGQFQPGQKINMSASSFSSSEKKAAEFSRMIGGTRQAGSNHTAVRFVLDGETSALPVEQLSKFKSEREWITGGEFEVVSYEPATKARPYYRVVIRQTKRLGA